MPGNACPAGISTVSCSATRPAALGRTHRAVPGTLVQTSNPSARWKAHVSRGRTVIYGLPAWLACLPLGWIGDIEATYETSTEASICPRFSRSISAATRATRIRSGRMAGYSRGEREIPIADPRLPLDRRVVSARSRGSRARA